MPRIEIFGGVRGRNISDFLSHRKRNIGAFINTLKHQQMGKQDIQERIFEHFKLEPIALHFDKKVIRPLHFVRNETQPVHDGFPKLVEVWAHSLEVPFTGDLDVLKCTPPLYYGTRDKLADVYEHTIHTVFEARKDFPPQIENFALESLGDEMNLNAMNEVILQWNKELKSYPVD